MPLRHTFTEMKELPRIVPFRDKFVPAANVLLLMEYNLRNFLDIAKYFLNYFLKQLFHTCVG